MVDTTGTRKITGTLVCINRRAFANIRSLEPPVAARCFFGSMCLISIMTRSESGKSSASLSQRQFAAVSTAVCSPSALLRFKDAVLEPSYQTFSYQDYFGTGEEESNLFHFLANSEEQITILGADLQWQGFGPVRLGGRYNHYVYDVRQETAGYYAALLSLDISGGSQLGIEAGRMDGEIADNIYTLYRAYFYWVNPFRLSESAFISGDGIFQAYDTPVFGEDSSINLSFSAGFHLANDSLEFKLTGLYSQDPYFEENVEGLVTLQYQY